MFTVNHQTNLISPVKVKTLSELGFTECKHLREWLAHQPDALGEELEWLKLDEKKQSRI